MRHRMIAALGYSQTPFESNDPGRLCRGRERWIEPWEGEPPATLNRVVISGAAFSDDSARDALRGLQHSGIDVAAVAAALFPRRQLLAFMEDGHPSQIPERAAGVEVYSGSRAGGHSQLTLVRWHCLVNGVREIRDVLGTDPNADRVRGFAVLHEGQVVDDALLDGLYLIVGMSSLDSPPARFQPAALPGALQLVKAVILIHRDKHGPALAVYATEPLKVESRLEPLCEKQGALLVAFAIPPMLARWDRALTEFRRTWEETRSEPYPVPQAPAHGGWEPRGRRRRRDGAEVDDDMDTLLIAEPDAEDTEPLDRDGTMRLDEQETAPDWNDDPTWLNDDPIDDEGADDEGVDDDEPADGDDDGIEDDDDGIEDDEDGIEDDDDADGADEE